MQIEAKCPLVTANRNKFKKMNQSEWNSQFGEVLGAAANRIVKINTSLDL